MKIIKVLTFLLLLSACGFSQTHTFCPLDGTCAWTGPQTFNAGMLTTTLDQLCFANQYTGADMGAKINAAATACGANHIIVAGPAGTISTALVLPAETILQLSPGFWIIAAGNTISSNGVKIRGGGPANTVLDISSATGDVFTVSGNDFELSGMQIRAKSGTPRTAGSVINATGNNGQVKDVKFVDPFKGISLLATTAGGWSLKDIQIATSGGNWDYFLKTYAASGTIASTTLSNIKGTLSGATQSSPFFIFDSRTDTVKGENIEVDMASQSCIKTQDTDSVGGFPRWLHFVNMYCEAPGVAGLDLASGRDFSYANGYVANSLNAVHIAALINSRFVGNIFTNISQHAVLIDASANPMTVFSSNVFEDVGQALTNTYDLFNIGANANHFTIIGNVARKVGTPAARYGANVIAGTSTDFTISGNNFVADVATANVFNGSNGTNWSVTGNLGTANTYSGTSLTVTGTVTAPGFVGTGSPKIASGSASNTDVNGILTLAAGTATYTFVNNYSSNPICLSKDLTTSTNATNEVVSGTYPTMILTITGTGTDSVKYICIGRN